MPRYQCQNPILLIIYKRTDTLKMILNQIALARPSKIYIASNSYKNEQEKPLVAKARKLVESYITWECEIKKLYRTEHLSTKLSLSSAISWFFENEEQGIILEDDCLPALSFFRFCDELLERYKNEAQIMMISGWSALDFAKNASVKNLSPKASLKEDYYFSKYNHIWGWASWARAWKRYELEIDDFKTQMEHFDFCNDREKRAWDKIFSSYAQGKIDTWDYPWTYSIWKNKGLCVYPKQNLISNIGFNRADAAHTSGDSKYATMPRYELLFPLTHPKKITQNKALDKINFEIVFNMQPLYERVRNKLKKMILKIMPASKSTKRSKNENNHLSASPQGKRNFS